MGRQAVPMQPPLMNLQRASPSPVGVESLPPLIPPEKLGLKPRLRLGPKAEKMLRQLYVDSLLKKNENVSQVINIFILRKKKCFVIILK